MRRGRDRREPDGWGAEALAEVRAIYAELAGRPVERACAGRATCCRFRLTGRTPYLTRGEALILAAGVRASGRRRLPEAPAGDCPLLHPGTGRCLAYDHRPFGCRTHFCDAAGGALARRDVTELIRRLERVYAALGGDGARALPVALVWALERRFAAGGSGRPVAGESR